MLTMKAAGIGGSILVILALVITFLKQIIAFIGFLTFAIKILLVIAFVAVFIGVGLMALRAFRGSRKPQE